MTRSRGEFSYSVLIHGWQFAEIYRRMLHDDLLWAAWPDTDDCEWSEDYFCDRLARGNILVIGGYVRDELAGVMTLTAVAEKTLCAEIGLTAFREHFPIARELCAGALIRGFELTGAKSFIGRIAAPHKHILRMFATLGFEKLGRVPGMIWHSRKGNFVDGILVAATPDSVREKIGG